MPTADDDRLSNALQYALKELQGRKLTARERKEILWLKEQWFLELSSNLPKKTYLQLTQRDHTELDRQARAYDLPLTGKTLDLALAVKALHDFIGQHGQKVKKFDEANAAKRESEAKLLEIKTRQAELDLEERLDKMIDRQHVREMLAWLAQQFQAMAEQVGRNHGPAPQASINGFLDIMRRELEEGGKLET